MLRSARFWNITFRSAHIVVAGALFGGHVFEIPPERLLVWLYATIATGVVLAALEAYPDLSWFHEARGLCVLGKMALLCCIPWLWEQRVGILVAVFVIGSVGSHMPRALRHYSPWLRRVVETSACVRHAAKGDGE
jgi:hypothetical protein